MRQIISKVLYKEIDNSRALKVRTLYLLFFLYVAKCTSATVLSVIDYKDYYLALAIKQLLSLSLGSFHFLYALSQNHLIDSKFYSIYRQSKYLMLTFLIMIGIESVTLVLSSISLNSLPFLTTTSIISHTSSQWS